MIHPYIRLELALGGIAGRENVLADLAFLPPAPVVAAEELFGLIDRKQLYRRGIGVTDLQLLWRLCSAVGPLLNEGHGFSRAINSGPERTALRAAEKFDWGRIRPASPQRALGRTKLLLKGTAFRPYATAVSDFGFSR